MLQAKRWQRCPSSTISPFPQPGQKSSIAATSPGLPTALAGVRRRRSDAPNSHWSRPPPRPNQATNSHADFALPGSTAAGRLPATHFSLVLEVAPPPDAPKERLRLRSPRVRAAPRSRRATVRAEPSGG